MTIGQLVSDPLIWRNPTSGADKPLLAKQWKRSDEINLELTISLAVFTLTNVATDRDGGIAGESATSADVDAMRERQALTEGTAIARCLV